MKSKFYLFAGLGFLALSANAQKLTEEYIEMPKSPELYRYVKEWTPGQQLFEDENFFISRVKPKPYIGRNTTTQVFETITDANDKKLLMWVPIGDTNRDGVHTNAFPNSIFDSEVFSMWSYVTHWGNWTSPYGWVPGGFADAAHKHGTAVSGVASVPNATLGGDWLTCMTAMAQVDAEKLGQFLLYHGVDGLGYNSEWYSNKSVVDGLNALHTGVVKYMKDKNDKFENLWYTGTEDSGSINGFYDGLRSSNQNIFGDSENIRTSLFLNYNWCSESKINTSQSTASALGRDMRDLYAGMNMQGGCAYSGEWIRHQTLGYSIGLWGAHDFNYLWSPRTQFGSSDIRRQETYQKLIEWWFTNGNRNPINTLEISSTKNLSANKTNHGMSRFMAERSTLGWSLADEPFISYFNLGNGRFFNWLGERQNDNEWYNIGIQDYMPTWRFWFADKFLGKDKSNVPASGLDAEFTWDDAWLGGSCLRIHGTSAADEYLHLFKTDFVLQANDVITVRYKLVAGAADVTLALTDGTELLAESSLVIAKASEADPDDERWIEVKFPLTQRLASQLRNKHISVIGLKFANANNLNMYLGEISFRRGTSVTPAAPQITLAKSLAYNYAGLDAKVIFNMPNNKPAGTPCYNLDVNTSMFRIWAQQEGCEPVNMGATSSWAAILYSIPVDHNKDAKVRVGVQAVSTDFASASEITWSDYIDCGEYKTVDEIQINKSTIKPGEEFEVSFLDPMHPAADWTISDKSGKVCASANGTSIKASLDELGSYDVKVGDIEKDDYISVTAWERGALPEIQSLTINDSEVSDAPVSIDVAEEFTLGYTGRESNGQASQAIKINEKFVGFPFANSGLGGRNSFGVGAWINLQYPLTGTRLMGIENRAASNWPVNNWGWVWSNFDYENGAFVVTFRTSAANGSPEIQYNFENLHILNNNWTHILFGFEWDGSGLFRLRLFMNGAEVFPVNIRTKGEVVVDAPDDPEDLWRSNSYSIDESNWFYLGGGAGSSPVYNNGVVDDLVVFEGPVTEADAKKAYDGLKADNLPANVKHFWSFENKPTEDFVFLSETGTNHPASNFGLVTGEAEGQSTQTPQSPELTSGCPLIDGDFKIEAVPTWKVKRATITEAAGTDKEGKAKMSIDREGEYTATLTLENSLGSHSMDYPVLKIGKSSIEAVEEGNDIEAYTIDDAVIISVVEGGNYTAAVYNMAGQLVAQRSANLENGGVMTVSVREAGVYLVNILADGKVVRTVKLIKK